MIRNKFLLSFIIAAIIISLAVNVEAGVVTVVDNNAGTHNSIATDLSGYVHISYGMGGGFHFNNVDALKYATNASGDWVTTTVDGGGYVGGYTSIATDSSSKVHISYYDYTNQDLKYATNASGNWVIATVDSNGDVGKYSSIAIDSADKIHISYYDYTNQDLKYATNVSGNWVKKSIGNSDYFTFSSIALDSKNNVLISFLANKDLKFITNATGDWVTTIVDNDIADSSNAGMYTSIATDSIDNVHISYMDKTRGHLKYATNASGEWVITEVESVNGITGEYSSIALDSKDKVHISYSNYTNGCVKYATNASGNWVITTLENYTVASNAWCYTSLAIDFTDIVHISYFEDEYLEKNLKYAVYTPPIYNTTGTWNYSESNNWASSGCLPDNDETGTLRITQMGNSVTLDSDGEAIDGSVSDENYYFSTSFYEAGGKTTYYVDFELSSNTSGSGEITWKQENGCEGGKDIILTRQGSQPSGDSGSDGGGGGCFIATAAYGSLIEPHVKILCESRDRFLLRNSVGKRFVRLYYTYSPPIAQFISNHNSLKAIVRLSLLPFIGLSWLSLKIGFLSTMACGFFFVSGFIGTLWFIKKCKN